jgi:hypothetical protein
MQSTKARYQLWQIMLAIAVLAGLFAAYGVIWGTAIGIVIGVIVLPILLAPAGCRLRAAAWVIYFYPLLVLSSLYATWFIAWCVLGHRPRYVSDGPGHISPAVDVPYIATCLLMVGWWFILPPSILIVLGEIGRRVSQETIGPRKGVAGMLASLLVWPATFIFLRLDLFGVFVWFID